MTLCLPCSQGYFYALPCPVLSCLPAACPASVLPIQHLAADYWVCRKQFTLTFLHEAIKKAVRVDHHQVVKALAVKWVPVVVQYDPQASGVIDYQALMKQLLHSDYYALYLGTVDNTQNTLDATSTFDMITNLKRQFAAQGHKLQQVCWCKSELLSTSGTALLAGC